MTPLATDPAAGDGRCNASFGSVKLQRFGFPHSGRAVVEHFAVFMASVHRFSRTDAWRPRWRQCRSRSVCVGVVTANVECLQLISAKTADRLQACLWVRQGEKGFPRQEFKSPCWRSLCCAEPVEKLLRTLGSGSSGPGFTVVDQCCCRPLEIVLLPAGRPFRGRFVRLRPPRGAGGNGIARPRIAPVADRSGLVARRHR